MVRIRRYSEIRDAAFERIAARREFERICIVIIAEALAARVEPWDWPDALGQPSNSGEEDKSAIPDTD